MGGKTRKNRLNYLILVKKSNIVRKNATFFEHCFQKSNIFQTFFEHFSKNITFIAAHFTFKRWQKEKIQHFSHIVFLQKVGFEKKYNIYSNPFYFILQENQTLFAVKKLHLLEKTNIIPARIHSNYLFSQSLQLS